MRSRLLKYSVLLFCLWLTSPSTTRAQLIRTTPPVPAEVQILLQLDEVQETWLVKRSGAETGGDGVPDPTREVSETEIKEQLRTLNGVGDASLYPWVRKYILLFTEDKRAHCEAVLGLQKFYAPELEAAIRRKRLPATLRYLPAALSGFNTFARGEESTAGMWRLHYHTALRYGLQVDALRDERHDPLRASEAALSYLSDLHQQFGDWNKAIFAYICGPANLNKARLRMAGQPNSLANLFAHLPVDSRDFFPAFIAHAYLFRHAGRWGLKPLNIQAPPSMAAVAVDQPLRKASVTKVIGISEAELRYCNPALWASGISKGNGVAQLFLPADFKQRFETERSRIFALEHATANAPTEPEVAPVALPKPKVVKPKPEPEVLAPPAGSKELAYTIQPGDNLGAIASKFGVSVRELQGWNGLNGTMIKADEQLKVYVANNQASKPQAKAVKAKPAPETKRGFTTYTVQSGDTFWSISQKYPGTNHLEIMEFNQKDSNLKPGQVIRIPKPE